MVHRLGPYRVLRLLATGGMGELYLAELDGPAGFSKILAIKRIRPHLAWDAHFVELFLEEARLAAALSHPNVVQIFELGQHEGSYYIAMEYVRGKSLRAVLRKLHERGEVVRPAMAARIASHVLHGLHHAHQLRNRQGEPRPVVHRDISPENVLLSVEGVVKLVDFGIAKAVTPGVHRLTGLLHGKLSYMSPEQLARRPVEPRTDVYGVAVLLFELLTGSPPFMGHSSDELRKKMKEGLPPIDARQPVPSWLARVVERGLAANIEERFASAEEMALVIEEHLRTLPDAPSPPQLARELLELFGPELEQLPAQSNLLATRPLEGSAESVTEPRKTLPVGESALQGAERSLASTVPSRTRSWRMPALLIATAVVAGAVGSIFSTPGPALRPAASVEAPVISTPKPEPALESGLPLTDVPRSPAPRQEVSEPPRAGRFAAPRNTRVRAYGTLDLRVHPWAEVRWNRRKLGITPMAPIRLPAGKQRLTLRNAELATVRRVEVHIAPNAETRLEVNLMPPGRQGAGASSTSK